MIVINLKTYSEVTINNNGQKLAQICDQASQKYNAPIVVCTQATDIGKISQSVSISIFAQHIDSIEPGKNTGFISALAVKENGAKGVMINHSEHRIGLENIQKTLELAKKYELQTLVCVENAQEAQKVIEWQPDMIALEDPVLIGGKESIIANEAGKQKVKEFVDLHLPSKCLVGAGVKDGNDMKVSRQMGADGVLIASGFDLSQNPQAVIEDLCENY
jgi:triosephosphate isomerase (TIM)